MEDKEVAQTFHQTSLFEESVKASDQEDQLKALGDENNATFKTPTNRIQNEEVRNEELIHSNYSTCSLAPPFALS